MAHFSFAQLKEDLKEIAHGHLPHHGAKAPKFADNYDAAGKDLGSGAFSVVKLCTHRASGKQYAVKCCAKGKLKKEDLDGLYKETQLLREMDHPHIIKCYETFDEGSTFYIVTELVSGGDLFDRIIHKTTYTEKEARDLLRIFFQTMAYMHDTQRVVHRDLKPENILLTSKADDADLKVADFGFAKRISDLTPKESACGTPGYIAPELLRGDSYGCEPDVWSMGVIAYVLLAGYPPFYEEDQMKLFRKIKSGQYYFHQERWNKHTPESMDMIRKMLCVDQKARWTAQQLLDHPWMRMGEDLLAARDLSMSKESLKKYVAKQRMRRAANAIIAMRRLSIHSYKSEESTRRDSSMQTSSMTPDSSAPNSAPPSAPTSTFTTPSPSMSAPAEGDAAAAAAAHEDHGHDLMHGDAHAHLPVGIGRTVLSEGHIVFKGGLDAIHHDHDHDEDFPADERAARPPADFF